MGEALLRFKLSQQSNTAMKVRSAGIQPLLGHPPDPLAIQLMAEKNLDISGYHGEKLTEELAHWADIILVMELKHKRHIENRFPSTRGRVFRMLEDEQQDIADPYRQGLQAFKIAEEQIQRGADQWAEKLA